MAPQELDGETLGEKHQDYNKIFKDQITTQPTITDINLEDTDVNNLLKIDLACHNKDVKYILEVLKSGDMLYVSRVLSKCKWLITDQQYADMINPDYLQSELFPNMTTKAIIKFKKHIRNNIKDESRAEKFYLSEKSKPEAMRWLPQCSVAFIEDNIENHLASETRHEDPLKLRLFKRLCEKSVSVFKSIIDRFQYYERQRYLQVATFLLSTNIDNYLDILEDSNQRYGLPKLNHRATDLIMKHSPKRVKDKMETYYTMIHIPTFVKYLKPDEIKAFLQAQANKDIESVEFSHLKTLFYCGNLKYFIKRLPKNEQFEFAKLCMSNDLPEGTEALPLNKLCTALNLERYVWYQFAPFDVAFEEITKMISESSNSHEQREMLSTLITCADHNLQNIQTLLKYFINKHKNEESCFKFNFVTDLLTHTRIAKYDENTWDLLNDLLTAMKIYSLKSDLCANNTEIVRHIIIYNSLNGKKIPEVIKKSFVFDTLKQYRSTMYQEQQNKMFAYLYDYILTELDKPVANQNNFNESVTTLENVLKLINDWGKSLLDYPLILQKIRELIALQKENAWKASLSSLYNVNKSWRKHMFEESMALYPSEEVCLNALKHDPQLLARHSGDVHDLRTNNNIFLQRLLAKLRIYWPHTLAQQWIDTYLENIKETKGQKAIIRGLCIMLPQNQLLEIVEKYKPSQPKIDWKQTDERVLNVQRLLAKCMHLARPQPNPDAILAYAKGDYLQFALGSVLAIFYNLKSPLKRQYIPKLLDAPVSIQKHGIRFAFKQLDRDELKNIFLNCWKTSKNASIRTIVFKFTFSLLCGETDNANALSLWELLELFIDNLTFTEDKDTYQLLSEVEKVPNNVKAQFLIKNYNFFQKLIENVDENDRSNYKWLSAVLAEYSRELIDTISQDFVKVIMQEFIDHDFFNCEEKFGRNVHHSRGILQVISAYLLCVTNEDDQIQRYEKVLVPLMRLSFEKWDEKRDGNYFIRQHFQQMLTRLTYDLKEYVIEKNLLIPLKMYTLILNELEKNLSVSENYMMLTKWKLTVALTQLAAQYVTDEKEWDEKLGLAFGNMSLEYLKKDVALHFPCIYVLFSKCVTYIRDILPQNANLEFFEGMLSDKEFVQGYLSSIEIGENYSRDRQYAQIWEQIYAHPSVEVKMHFYSKIEKKKY